eukprot:m.81299 g.81299  ORF g.81299 m.81299 type:complete len:258 (+) comp12803_c0_seq1:426-1199(+)
MARFWKKRNKTKKVENGVQITGQSHDIKEISNHEDTLDMIRRNLQVSFGENLTGSTAEYEYTGDGTVSPQTRRESMAVVPAEYVDAESYGGSKKTIALTGRAPRDSSTEHDCENDENNDNNSGQLYDAYGDEKAVRKQEEENKAKGEGEKRQHSRDVSMDRLTITSDTDGDVSDSKRSTVRIRVSPGVSPANTMTSQQSNTDSPEMKKKIIPNNEMTPTPTTKMNTGIREQLRDINFEDINMDSLLCSFDDDIQVKN